MSEASPFPRPFQIIAHRGASAYAPENTLAAFRVARQLGAVEVELDVQLTQDDQVVLFHDDSLDRKTARTGRVRDYSLAELLETDIGSWFDASHPGLESSFAGTRIDSLARLFAEMGPALFYHVELKDAEPALPMRTLELIDRYGLRDRVIVTSFRSLQLERMRKLAPGLRTCLLIAGEKRRKGSLEDWIDRAATAGMTQVGVVSRELTRDLVRRARSRGLWIRAWGIKSLEDMDHAIAVGSNGMTIDWPEKLIARFLERAGSAGATAPR